MVNPAEVEVVREAAQRVLAGHKLYRISLDFNARGIPTRRKGPRGGLWTQQTIRRILICDAVLGRVTHHGELLRDDDGMPLEVWQPILDRETSFRVRSVLEVDKAGKKRNRRARLMSAIVTCAECSRAMYVTKGSKKLDGTPTVNYLCAAKSSGSHNCIGASIQAEALEYWVTVQFLEKFGDREVMQWVEELPDLAAMAEIEAAFAATAAKMLTMTPTSPPCLLA